MLASPGDQRRRLLPHLLLFVVVLIWSSNTVVSKIALRDASPALLALVRISLAVLPFHLPILLVFLRVAMAYIHGKRDAGNRASSTYRSSTHTSRSDSPSPRRPSTSARATLRWPPPTREDRI